VGALAITGLTLIAPPAQAVESSAVRLISQRSGVASTKPDGGGSAIGGIRLTAARLDPTAEVTFAVNPDPKAGDASSGWVTVGEADMANPDFGTYDWSGELNGTSLAGSRVALRAASVVGSAAPTYSTVNDVLVAGPTSPAESVRIESFNGGYFVQPYADAGRTQSLVAVSGHTSATDGTVALTPWRTGAAAYGGRVDAAVSPDDLKVESAAGPGGESVYTEGGEFQAALPLAAFDAQAGDSIAVRAERDSDEVAAAQLLDQEIGAISVESMMTTTTGTVVELVVTDTGSFPVAGAEVRRSDDGAVLGYTDGAGIVRTVQPNNSSATYYVNTTDADAFQDGTDFATDTVNAPAYAAEAVGVRARLADGRAFDDDEYAAGDVALQVVDQEGKPFPGVRDLTYTLYRTGSAEPAATTVTTDASGRAVVPFDTAGADGHWTMDYAGVGDVRRTTFVAGDATLALTPGAGAAASGGTIAYAGRLAVGEWPLTGRAIGLAYARGTELVPGAGADAGLGAGRATSGSTTTAADGGFAVTVVDPAESGRPTEGGGRLTATAAAAKETASAGAAFGTGKGTVRLKLAGSSKGAAADRLVVTGPAAVAGEKVRLLAKVGKKWKGVATARLGKKGDVTVTVKDRNGRARTTYVVRLLASARTATSTSKTAKLS
jgi:hypothetical protein